MIVFIHCFQVIKEGLEKGPKAGYAKEAEVRVVNIPDLIHLSMGRFIQIKMEIIIL